MANDDTDLESNMKNMQLTLTLQIESLQNQIVQLESSTASTLEGFLAASTQKASDFAATSVNCTQKAVLAVKGMEKRIMNLEKAQGHLPMISSMEPKRGSLLESTDQVEANSMLKALELRLNQMERAREHLQHGEGSSVPQSCIADSKEPHTKVQNLDALLAEVADIQRWRAEVDAHFDYIGKLHRMGVQELAKLGQDTQNRIGVQEPAKLEQDVQHESIRFAASSEDSERNVKSEDTQEGSKARPPMPTRSTILESISKARDHATRQVGLSAWECTLLVSVPGAGLFETVVLMSMVFLNCLLQISFAVVTLYSFADSQAIKLWPNNAKRWRMESAHRYDLMDQLSWVSMVDKVCQEDQSLTFATAQIDILSKIRPYMQTVVTGIFTVGQALCFLVLVIWTLLCAVELKQSFEFLRAILNLPRRGTHLVLSDSGSFVLESIHILTLSFSVYSTLCRFVVVVLLGYAGSRWLAVTVDMEELVLNSAALAFVFEVDEMISYAFTPSIIRSILERLEPLQRPSPYLWKKVEMSRFLVLLWCVGWITYFTTQYVKPLQDVLDNIEKEMCGYNTHFVIDVHQPFTYAIVSKTNGNAYIESVSLLRNVTKEFTNQETDIEKLNPATVPAKLTTSREEFLMRMTEHLGEFVYLCSDDDASPVNNLIGREVDSAGHAGDARLTYWMAIKYLVQIVFDQTLTNRSCAAAKIFCNDRRMELLRYLCPRSCGCGNPSSGLMYLAGCPDVCRNVRDSVLQTYACKDSSPNELRSSEGLIGYELLSERIMESHASSGWARSVLPDPLLGSCSDAAQPANFINPCGASETKGSLRAFCPVTCGCTGLFANGQNHPFDCPTSCRSGAGSPPEFPCSEGLCPAGTLPATGVVHVLSGVEVSCLVMHSYIKYEATEQQCMDVRYLLGRNCCIEDDDESSCSRGLCGDGILRPSQHIGYAEKVGANITCGNLDPLVTTWEGNEACHNLRSIYRDALARASSVCCEYQGSTQAAYQGCLAALCPGRTLLSSLVAYTDSKGVEVSCLQVNSDIVVHVDESACIDLRLAYQEKCCAR